MTYQKINQDSTLRHTTASMEAIKLNKSPNTSNVTLLQL